MRLSTNLIRQQGINSILNQQAKVSRTQLQIGSGKKILSPSDDPSGIARTLQFREAIDKTQQYQKNIDTVRLRLSQEESALETATNIIQRARELAVQGLNDVLSADDRLAIEREVRQLIEGMLSVANTKNAGGEYVFSGTNTKTEPYSGTAAGGGFAYAGNNSARNLQIGPSRLVSDSNQGEAVFGLISTDSVFDTLFNFADDLVADAPNSTSLDEIDQALDRVIGVRTEVGARLRTLDIQQEENAGFIFSIEIALSQAQDLDYAEAISRFNLQSVALEAAQQAYVRVQGLSLFNFL